MSVEDLLPEKYRDKAADYEKGTDTMDVWFDSGIMIKECQLKSDSLTKLQTTILSSLYFSSVCQVPLGLVYWGNVRVLVSLQMCI